jgi:uncharacterized membrane protein
MIKRREILFAVATITLLVGIGCKRSTMTADFASRRQVVREYRTLHKEQAATALERPEASVVSGACATDKKSSATAAPKRKAMVVIPVEENATKPVVAAVPQHVEHTEKMAAETKKKQRPIKKEMDERLSRGLLMTIFGGVAVALGIIFINLAPTGLFIFAFSIVFLVGLVSLISYWANPKPKM